MATNNITFPIKKSDGTSFYGLVLHNATFDSVVMSLGDKITGDVYYRDNTLAVTMSEYIEYKRNEDSEAVKFVLVNPPTVVREGIVSDNSELRGMTKYSFVFYHPMYAISNFPFTDVAVSSDEQKYLSNSKTFNWIGNLFDMVAKLNKNLQGTQWVVGTNIEHYEQDGTTETSMWQKAAKIPDEPLSFDKTYVSEVLKTSYETWEIPFVVDQIAPTDARYAQGKRFLILFGTPSNEILDDQNEPYIFRFGQGVGLKNNSRTPKNNKIVTRIVGYGSEMNIPFGYPQIPWYGDQSWDYTIDNDSTNPNSYPIYKGIYGGQYIKLIKHPFTRNTLMPTIYAETLFNKVSPYLEGDVTAPNYEPVPNPNYNPHTEIIDYYDADNSYVNPIVEGAESVEIHQFEEIKPEFTEHSIVDAFAYDSEHEEAISYAEFIQRINVLIAESTNKNESYQLTNYRDSIDGGMLYSDEGSEGGSYTWHRNLNTVDEYYIRVRYTSDSANFNWLVVRKNMVVPATQWDDTMDDDGNYKQSYFKITLPQLDFDLYACASITEEMKINMRSGACIGCTFDIAVDWDDYKANFYDSNGNFLPYGEQRDLTKYPKTNLGQVTFVVKKDLDTFGTLMPNTYQQPHSGDEFVILGISLPTTYVTNAEARLDDAAKEYMRENNVHYYEYPLKFDEHFLATHTDILSQIRNNTIVRFQYGGELPMALYVKQMTIKYGGVLPTYDITLTDDVEIVLNQIGQVTDDVSRMRVQVSELQKYYSQNIIQAINEKLSKVVDDVCQGRITFQQGLDSIGSAIFHDELRSPDFTSGLYTGRGWRVDQLGNAEMESLRVRSYLEVIELLVNRMQAQEGDTMFTDNDQIEKVDAIDYENTRYYRLSLKEKWGGYVTAQVEGNIIRGIMNASASRDAGVSSIRPRDCVENYAGVMFYTSWMHCVDAPSGSGITLDTNQILVVLYSNRDTPARRNFPPCELMNIARWGHIHNPSETEDPYEKARRRALQSSFYISTKEGRIVKLNGVNSPILNAGNYGTTLGELPDFVKQYSAVAPRLVDGGDYLYAQGIVVGDFIKIDKVGNPIVNYVDKGDWQDNTEYLVNEYNENTMQYETHDVWHNGSYWRCTQHQPVNGIYYEPNSVNSAYWQKLMWGGDSTRLIYSYSSYAPVVPQQYTQDDEYLPSGWSNTPLTLSQQHKDVYVSTRKKHNGTWGVWSTPALFSHLAEDGTSISIKGVAIEMAQGTWPDILYPYEQDLSTTSIGDVILFDETHDPQAGAQKIKRVPPFIEDEEEKHFVVEPVDTGDGYLIVSKDGQASDEGHLYMATDYNDSGDSGSEYFFWQDCGRIKGDKGDDGKNTATVFIYKRFASQPTSTDKPTATLTYSFANGSLSGNLNGWSAIIPQSDGNPCWVRQVFVSSDSPTVTIVPTSWSTANKYTEDGKNGVSIEAQYSPDTIQIHTTWQTGDLYMRTRATNEASWSDWQRIVGENGANGDYTDYSFGISALLKTDLPTTAPSDISTWADAPVETTEQKPYLWSRVIKYVWVNGVKTVESTTYIRLTGEQGKNGKDATYVYLKGTAISNDGSGTAESPLVKVNGGVNLVTASGRGLNLVTLNRQTLAKVESITYDTYGEASGESGATGITDLVTKLNSLNSSVFVCLVSYDAIGWSSTLIEALQGYGMGELPYTATWRYPFLFFGYRGLGRGNGITRMNNATSPAENVEASVYVANGALTQPEAKRGKTGRFYYYSGFDWNPNDNTHTFVVNDVQVPYFSKAGSQSNQYYLFNPDVMPSGGVMTMAQMAAATTSGGSVNWNSKPWEVMTNDFKYIITQALFATLAKLGSWTFNLDYMYSDLGLNHSSQQESPQGNLRYDGIGDSDNTWTPNVSIDAANGRASFGRDKIRFQPDGSGWLANGNISWTASGAASFTGDVHNESSDHANKITISSSDASLEIESSVLNSSGQIDPQNYFQSILLQPQIGTYGANQEINGTIYLRSKDYSGVIRNSVLNAYGVYITTPTNKIQLQSGGLSAINLTNNKTIISLTNLQLLLVNESANNIVNITPNSLHVGTPDNVANRYSFIWQNGVISIHTTRSEGTRVIGDPLRFDQDIHVGKVNWLPYETPTPTGMLCADTGLAISGSYVRVKSSDNLDITDMFPSDIPHGTLLVVVGSGEYQNRHISLNGHKMVDKSGNLYDYIDTGNQYSRRIYIYDAEMVTSGVTGTWLQLLY